VAAAWVWCIEAEDVKLHRHVALKFLPEELAKSAARKAGPPPARYTYGLIAAPFWLPWSRWVLVPSAEGPPPRGRGAHF